jgi:hypothetical protein
MESTLNVGAQSSTKADEEKMRHDRRAKLKELNSNPKNQGPYILLSIPARLSNNTFRIVENGLFIEASYCIHQTNAPIHWH